MALSRVTKIGDGTATQFVVNFANGYIDRAHVTARVGTEVDGLGNPVYRAITFLSSNLLQIAGTPAGIGVKVLFERTVPKDTLLINFNDGDTLDEVNLDTSQRQVLHAVQEVIDGRFSTLTQNLDMGGFKTINNGVPTAPGDGATKGYVDDKVGDLASIQNEIETVYAIRNSVITAASIDDEIVAVADISSDVSVLAANSAVISGTAGAVRFDENVYIGDGVTTTWTLTRTPVSATNVNVWIGGAIQRLSDYTVDGNQLSITPAVANGVQIIAKTNLLVNANDVYDARDDAVVAWDLFDARYLGEKISLPSVDNNGDALVEGALVSLTGQTPLSLNGMYVRRDGLWIFVAPDAWTRAEADARYPLSANTARSFATRTDAIAANLSGVPFGGMIFTEGYAAADDRGGAAYVKVASTPAHSGFFTASDGSVFELRAFQPTIEMFGGGTGVVDNVAAYNAALAYCAARGLRHLRMEAVGTYRFASKPNIIQSPLIISGAGKSFTYLRRDYSGAGNDDGFIEFRHPSAGGQILGSAVKGIHLFPANGTTNGTMLKVSTQGPISGFFTTEDFCVSQGGTTGTYWRAYLVDGSANTTPGGQGFRDVEARGTFLFSTSENAETLRVLNGVNCTFDLWTNGNVTIFGGAVATEMSTRINIYGIILGQLFIGNASRITSWAQANTVIHSTNSNNSEHWGNISVGGYSNTGAASNLCGSAVGFDANRGGTSGYQRLPGGGLIQRMRVTLTTSFASYTFPTAFTTGCTPIVVGTSRSSAFTVFGGSHSLSAASLAGSSAGEADIIAFGW